MKRETWRPIEELHDDHGEVLAINAVTGEYALVDVCEDGFDALRWTRFAELPLLTENMIREWPEWPEIRAKREGLAGEKERR